MLRYQITFTERLEELASENLKNQYVLDKNHRLYI